MSNSYDVITPDGTKPHASAKEIYYIFKKIKGKWWIGGIYDMSKVNENIKITKDNIPLINKVLSNSSQSNRMNVFTSTSIEITESDKKVTWSSHPNADLYVVSITDMDLSKVRTGNLIWKIDQKGKNYAHIPLTIFDKLTKDKTYYLNVFSYSAAGIRLKGQIIKVFKK